MPTLAFIEDDTHSPVPPAMMSRFDADAPEVTCTISRGMISPERPRTTFSTLCPRTWFLDAGACLCTQERYRRWVEENLGVAGGDGKPFRKLPFWSPRGGDACRRSLRLVDEMLQESKELDTSPACRRHIPKCPQKALDAPEMADDFYLNLMDLGRENMLAMALASDVYLKKEHDKSVLKLPHCDIVISPPTSVAWSCDGKRLAVGCADSQIEVSDIQPIYRIRTFEGHTARMGSLSWNGQHSDIRKP